jgi:hypothetical protein
MDSSNIPCSKLSISVPEKQIKKAQTIFQGLQESETAHIACLNELPKSSIFNVQLKNGNCVEISTHTDMWCIISFIIYSNENKIGQVSRIPVRHLDDLVDRIGEFCVNNNFTETSDHLQQMIQ